jgi:hypothetical protein
MPLKPIGPDATEAQLKSVPIAAVAERFGLKLEVKGGIGECLCPLHSDKDTPSFKIYLSTNSFFCFGCRAGGDVIELVLRYNQKFNSDFKFTDATEWLSKNFLTLKEYKLPTPKPKEKPKLVAPDNVLYWNSLMFFNDKQEWFKRRGFCEEFIRQEFWGYDGNRYVIPIWEGEPGYSNCLGVRLRKQEGASGPKYVGLENHNQNTVWGRHYCKGQKTILAFAGELDAARAVQDGLPAFSVVNGMYAFTRFEENWANLWFPDAEELITVYDKNETNVASKLALEWDKQKGVRSASVFQWNPYLDIKDYCEFRDRYSLSYFLEEFSYQGFSIGGINWKL